jgi:NitT/TauT family transport system substrate-binding protein
MSKRLLATLLVAAMTVTMVAGCSNSNKKTEITNEGKELTKIVVSEFRNASWSAAYVAEANGYFEEEGLEVEWALYDDGPIAFQGMHSGDSQFCLLSQEPVLKAQQEGLESTFIYSVLDTRLYGFVSNPEIKEVADLKGKVVFAGMQGSAPYSFVSSILREAGLDPEKDVTFVNMDYGASMAALEANQIQASYINVDNRIEVQAMDVNILVDTSNEVDSAKYLKSDVFPGEIICATTKYVEENPETVQAFVNAISKATDWMNEHTGEEIAAAIASYFDGMTKEVLAQKMDIVKSALTKTGYIGEEPEVAVQDFCIGNGVIAEQIPYDEMVNMTFVNKYQESK